MTLKDESGWLIENGQLCLGTECRKPAWVTFTHEGAIRFARRVDAESMLISLKSFNGDAFKGCTVNDHLWVSNGYPEMVSK